MHKYHVKCIYSFASTACGRIPFYRDENKLINRIDYAHFGPLIPSDQSETSVGRHFDGLLLRMRKTVPNFDDAAQE